MVVASDLVSQNISYTLACDGDGGASYINADCIVFSTAACVLRCKWRLAQRTYLVNHNSNECFVFLDVILLFSNPAFA